MADEEIASVDGLIGPAREATLTLPDDGLFRGDGAFEVLRLYAGRPFALGEHLDRLERSASRISLPVDRPAFEREILAVVERIPDDRLLRVIATRGGRRLVFSEPMPNHPDTLALAVVTYSSTVILDGVKSISYAANMHATRLAKDRGADDALLVEPDGIVLEAPTSTIFWAVGGELRTPSLELPILDSITRRHIVAGTDVTEGSWPLDELLGADEAFIASTTREVHPVARIGDTQFETYGPASERAQAAFTAALERDLGDA